MKKQDVADEAEVKEGEETSTEDTSVEKQSSKEKPGVSEEAVEEIVKKRVSDILAKRGDKAKTLEERLETLENENKVLREKQLEAVAVKYGLKVEQIKQIGVDSSDKLEELVSLFGSKETKGKEIPRTHSIETTGGGKMGWAEVQAMTPKEIKKLKEEHNVEELTELIDKGVISPPKLK